MSDAVRIKAYGLVEFTKSGYLKVQSVVLAVTLILILATAVWWRPTGILADNFFFANLAWFFVLILVLEVAETAVMLRKFRVKEARRARTGHP